MYGNKKWKSVARMYKMKNPVCKRCKEKGQAVQAKYAAHIKAVERGGDPYDEDNLQSLCESHYKQLKWKRETFGDAEVIVLSGPPGAGKTTYVKSHIEPGDVVFDFDLVYHAVTGLPMHTRDDRVKDLVFQLREKFYQVVREPNRFHTAWIITAETKAEKRLELCSKLNARSFILLEEAAVCKESIQSREVPSTWELQVDMWFDEFTMDQEKETTLTRAVKITE